MTFSVIIPTLNEEGYIARLLEQLSGFNCVSDESAIEVILVDAGSKDGTLTIAQNYAIKIIQSDKKGRAYQMNLGAQEAVGDVLYFVHADVQLCEHCFKTIEKVIESGFSAGCFSYEFDSKNILLSVNAWFTSFENGLCGGGDQTLFITAKLFEEFGGFNEKYILMEDFELTRRLREAGHFKVIDHKIKVSARKYEKNSYLRVQLANLIVFTMFRMGKSPVKLAEMYRRLLR